MAVTPTVTVLNGGQIGQNDYYAYGKITVTGTYATGGIDLTGLFSGQGVKIGIAERVFAYGSGRLLEWDRDAQKLLVKAWATAGATVAASEITAGTDIGATTDTYFFFAIGQ